LTAIDTTGSDQSVVIKSAGITLIGSALGGLMIILGEVLAARLLTGQAYGLYASGITVARIGEVIAVFGLPVSIFHYIPIYRRSSQRHLVIGSVYAASLLPLILGSAFALAAWVAAPWLGRHVFSSTEVVRYIRLLVLAVPFMASAEILGAITRGFGYAKYYVIVKNLIPPVVFLTTLALMRGLGAQPMWIAGAVSAGSMLACAAGVFAVVRVAGPDLWHIKPAFQFGALYKFASGVMVNTIFYLAFAVAGIFTVAVFHGSDSVGIYRMCLQIVLPFEMIVLAFHAAMGPVYPVLAQEERTAELEAAYGTAVRWMAMLHLPLGIALAWNRHDLLALLSPRFMAGSGALLILSVGFSACMCFGTAAYLLMLSGRKTVETRNAAFAAFLNVVLGVVLVPDFGLAGAAFATAFSLTILTVLRIWEVRYTLGLRTFRPYFVRVVAISIFSCTGAFYGLQLLGILQGHDPVSLACRIAAMGIVDALCLWFAGLNRPDKDTLRALIRSISGRTAPALGAASGLNI
jgi:O-antigen/teichoic acid export membrane protein